MKTKKIEILFPVGVDLPLGFERLLDALVDQVCKHWERDNPTMIMWPSGCGAKPIFSQADAAFLGKPVDPNAPATGEPTWDNDTYQIDVACREDYDGQNPFNPERERRRAEANARFKSRKAAQKESREATNHKGDAP